MKSRYTNVKYICEISWYFSVHCLLQSLRNYKEEAKIKPSEKALDSQGNKHNKATHNDLPLCYAWHMHSAVSIPVQILITFVHIDQIVPWLMKQPERMWHRTLHD